MVAFSYSTSSIELMMLVGALGGFLALFAQSFAPAVLASGTGAVMGFGRGGAVLGPWAAGIFLKAGFALGFVAPTMSLGSAISGVSFFIR